MWTRSRFPRQPHIYHPKQDAIKSLTVHWGEKFEKHTGHGAEAGIDRMPDGWRPAEPISSPAGAPESRQARPCEAAPGWHTLAAGIAAAVLADWHTRAAGIDAAAAAGTAEAAPSAVQSRAAATCPAPAFAACASRRFAPRSERDEQKTG